MATKKGLICLMIFTFTFAGLGVQAANVINPVGYAAIDVMRASGREIHGGHDRSAEYWTAIEGNRTHSDVYSNGTDVRGNRAESINRVDIDKRSVGINNRSADRDGVTGRFDNLGDHWATDIVKDFSAKGSFDMAKHSNYSGQLSRLDAIILVMATIDDNITGAGNRMDLPFVDAGSIPMQYRPIVEEAYAKGIIHGEAVGDKWYVYPNRAVTHAEISVMLSNAHEIDSRDRGIHNIAEAPLWADTAYTELHRAGAISSTDTTDINITRNDAIGLIYNTLDAKDGRYSRSSNRRTSRNNEEIVLNDDNREMTNNERINTRDNERDEETDDHEIMDNNTNETDNNDATRTRSNVMPENDLK